MSYQQKKVIQSVFRAYDVRGIIGTELDEDAYYSIGLAMACYLSELNRKQIYLAYDGRLSSPSLSTALKQGLLDSGIDVVNLGSLPTPVLYYATYTQGLDSGLIVTGSHNPADYNGIKIVMAGKTFTQENINYLFSLVESGQRLHGQGHESTLEVMPHYKSRILEDIHIKRPLKVVVDCGNGIAALNAPDILTALGVEVIPLYCEIDGRFPNHHPDPTVEANLADLKKLVNEHQADLGLAFDGDADRLGLITNKGEMIWPDRLMMFYAQEILQRLPGSTIVYDVKCSSHLAQIIEQGGGVARMCPTGHSIVKAVMKEEKAALAGEMSGHLFFKDRWYGFDDALYSACRLLEIISASDLSVSEQFALIPNSVNTPEIKIDINDENKFIFMQQFSEEAEFSDAHVIDIDGLRVEFAAGWGLLRASNTTPCLVARFEANDAANLKRIQDVFREQIQKVDPLLVVPF